MGNYLDDEMSVQTTLQIQAQSTCKSASNKEHMEFRHTCKYKKTADYKRMLILFVVDSIKLHLTAFNAIS